MINIFKLEAAFKRGSRAKGVSVPISLDLAVESILVSRQRSLWERATEAVMRIVPVTDAPLFLDISQREVTSIINQVYRDYSGLTTLDRNLKRAYERGNTLHKARYLREMNRAIGVDISDLLVDAHARVEVDAGVKRSTDLIRTLDETLKNQLSQEIWTGISSGTDKGSLRQYILERSSVSEARARLIARDQVGKLFSNLSQVRQKDAGIVGYHWRTVGDGAVRPSHEELDGKYFTWDNPPSVGHPGEDIQCRCIADPDLSTAKLFA